MLLQEEDHVELTSGENYILYNNLKGYIIIWINCEKDLQVRVSTEEFKEIASSIFPQLHIPELLKYLNQSEYVFTDKLQVRPLRAPELPITSPVPTLKDVQKALNQQRNKKNHFKF